MSSGFLLNRCASLCKLEEMKKPKHEAFEGLRTFVIETRNRNGWSQREVASRGGFNAGILAKLEAGEPPTIPKQDTLERIAKGLGVPYETLDRLARGLPPTLDEEAEQAADRALYQKVDELPIAESDRAIIKASLKAMLAAIDERERKERSE